MAKKPRADSKLKLLPDGDQETFWRMLHPEDPEVKPATLDAVAAVICKRYDFETLSLSTLSEWHSWYALRERTRQAQARADQAKLEWLKENPEASPEDLEKLGQMVFTSEAIEGGNVKAFVALMRERSRRAGLEIDRRKLALLEEKARRADEAEKVTGDGSLSAEEKQRRLKNIFGMGG